ncbi:S-layer protein [uncultured archaeon]|nr:S-layer protein [uncultured archaeon]
MYNNNLLIISLAIFILLIFILLMPVDVVIPYQKSEQYEEEYKIVEPRVVQVADYVITNVTINESFTDVRNIPEELQYTSYLKTCKKDISFLSENFRYKDWGSYYLIPYGDQSYFSGYMKGKLFSNDISTFNTGLKSGHVYNILMNDNTERILNQGDYLSLVGYSLQVNAIDKEPKNVSSRSCWSGGHYEGTEDELNNGGGCTYSYKLIRSATISLLDNNIINTRTIEGETDFTYEKKLDGGETIPMIIIHISNVSENNVTIDGVFQISSNYVQLPPLGSEVTVTIENTDTVPGTFGIWEGFSMENDTKIGRFDEGSLLPSESKDFTYTTDKNVTDCEFYTYPTSKKTKEENFTNFQDVIKQKRGVAYRNVTQYVDVIKKRPAVHNVSGYEQKRMYLFQKILGFRIRFFSNYLFDNTILNMVNV